MIDKLKIVDLIEEYKREKIEGVKRELMVRPVKGKGIVIYGPRRVGKSYYIKLLLKEKKDETLFLDFEDPRLIDFEVNDIFDILNIYEEVYGSQPKYIVLDEIQNISNWERIARYLIEKQYYVFITGSSSKLLSKEIATSLRGRVLSYLLLPFSFKEYLKTKGINYKNHPISYKEKYKLLYLLEEYLKKGGLPEILINNNLPLYDYLKQYFDTVLFRDVVERYGIKDIKILKHILKILIDNYTKEYSVNKIYNTFISKGIKLRKNKIYDLVSYIENTFFIYALPRYEKSLRLKELYIMKIYLMDIGFSYLSTTKSITRDIENTVFLELIRRGYEVEDKLVYYKTKEGYEVDFLIKEETKIKELIQVSYANSYEEISEREIRALLHAKEDLKLGNDVPLTIITWDYEDEKQVEWWRKKGRIRFVPLWKWLLNIDKNNKVLGVFE